MSARFANRVASVALLCMVAATPALSQNFDELDKNQPVALVADDLTYDSESGRLVATGNVEVYYGDRTLTADQITYDDNTKRITAEGDIVLRDPTGATVYGEFADLDSELRDGIVKGAQSVLAEQGKLAAVEGKRFDERYNVLSKAVYSPCDVCSDEPTPLWRIRARKVIHDEVEKEIYYENAWFDLLGVPVFWTPYFSHPDPTVDRASGFVTPTFKQSSNYGFGLKVPYYWVIDDQSDLTVEPFFTTKEGILGEAEYRRVFDSGSMRVAGSLARTDFTGEEAWEGHLDTDGLFTTYQDIKLGWDIKFASDDGYLRYFDFSNVDQLESEIFTYKYTDTSYFDVRGVRFQSLRNDEPAGQIPQAIPDVVARYEMPGALAGGDVGFIANAQSLFRTNGIDSTRISLGVDWEREIVLPMGVALTGFAEARGDVFSVRDQIGEPNETSYRFAPVAGVEARYPLLWEMDSGNAHFVEPIVQAIYSPYGGNSDNFINEDSLVTEFDEHNLFDRTHFSGIDAFESGPRLNVGLTYEWLNDDGYTFSASGGRVLRLKDATEFSEGTGLRNAQSDWVAGWSASYDPYVTIRHRFRIGDDLDINRNELTAALRISRFSLAGNYTFLVADPDRDLPDNREEFTLYSGLELSPNWRLAGSIRRDLEEGEFVSAGAGVTYANECCEIILFVSRDFTSTEDVAANTSVNLQVRLLTLGTSDTGLFTDTIFDADRVDGFIGPDSQVDR
ncbi:LPS-assembly protein LptD [Rhodobacteraceae bacterium NNCM2]|nr:LPS-assembly protein LptD [Coraliihabitans acroporae]